MTARITHTMINFPATQFEYCLAAQEVESLDGITAGSAVVCTGGVLWLTQAGDPQDYLLREGEMFVAERPGMVLVQALNDFACWKYLG